MIFGRIAIALCLLPIFAEGVRAQFQPAPPQQEPPCVQEFMKLRTEAEKKATAIRAAGERKAPPREACQLFTGFVAAQTKMLKYAETNGVWCGIALLVRRRELHPYRTCSGPREQREMRRRRPPLVVSGRSRSKNGVSSKRLCPGDPA